MSMSINKMIVKNTKRARQWIDEMKNDGKSEAEIEELLEKRLDKELNSIHKSISTTSVVKYDGTKIRNEILKKANRKNIDINGDILTHLYSQIEEQDLVYYDINEIKKEGSKISFSVRHESFEIDQFREKIIPSYNSLYASVSIERNSPFALVYINGTQYIFGAVRTLIKEFISDDFTINSVKWDDGALRAIINEFSEDIILINARGIEGNITARATSDKLNDSNMLTEIEAGTITSVKFSFKKPYPENNLFIDGAHGYINTSLSDNDAKTFIQNELLRYSSI
ncbi:MAG: hypothetical protein QXU18_13395 [Thermoplasmatales archaeon]